jgi:hypothetical protein
MSAGSYATTVGRSSDWHGRVRGRERGVAGRLEALDDRRVGPELGEAAVERVELADESLPAGESPAAQLRQLDTGG